MEKITATFRTDGSGSASLEGRNYLKKALGQIKACFMHQGLGGFGLFVCFVEIAAMGGSV